MSRRHATCIHKQIALKLLPEEKNKTETRLTTKDKLQSPSSTLCSFSKISASTFFKKKKNRCFV